MSVVPLHSRIMGARLLLLACLAHLYFLASTSTSQTCRVHPTVILFWPVMGYLITYLFGTLVTTSEPATHDHDHGCHCAALLVSAVVTVITACIYFAE